MTMRRILKEILILVASLFVVPVYAAMVALRQGYLNSYALSRLESALFHGTDTLHFWAILILAMMTPYLIIQAIRSLWWADKSLTGRRWANGYFSILFLAAAWWALAEAWDLFYFMYAMGDMPAELIQFLELEGWKAALGIGAIGLAGYCLRIFWDPTRGRGKSLSDSQPSRSDTEAGEGKVGIPEA